jgi:hypothetical protein
MNHIINRYHYSRTVPNFCPDFIFSQVQSFCPLIGGYLKPPCPILLATPLIMIIIIEAAHTVEIKGRMPNTKIVLFVMNFWKRNNQTIIKCNILSQVWCWCVVWWSLQYTSSFGWFDTLLLDIPSHDPVHAWWKLACVLVVVCQC